MHGHTYQAHAIGCAAALEVFKIIRSEKLVQNVGKMGQRLESALRSRLSDHPFVGDIRGRGLFWGIELVRDKATRTPFPAEHQVASELAALGFDKKYAVAIYPGSGTMDGVAGDHFIIAPAYNVTEAEIDEIVDRVGRLISDFFDGRQRS